MKTGKPKYKSMITENPFSLMYGKIPARLIRRSNDFKKIASTFSSKTHTRPKRFAEKHAFKSFPRSRAERSFVRCANPKNQGEANVNFP